MLETFSAQARIVSALSTIVAEVVFEVLRGTVFMVSTLSKCYLGYPRFCENSNPLQLRTCEISEDR